MAARSALRKRVLARAADIAVTDLMMPVITTGIGAAAARRAA